MFDLWELTAYLLHEALQWYSTVHEKNQHHFVIKDITTDMKTFICCCITNIRDINFCDAIVSFYDKMYLNFFINTIVKPHVNR